MSKESPTRAENDEISCPNDGSSLQPGQAPFKIREHLVGNFDALVCKSCNFFMLTSLGYQKAMKEAQNLGIVGAQESPESEVYEKQVDVVGKYVSRFQIYFPMQKSESVILDPNRSYSFVSSSNQEAESINLPTESTFFTSAINNPHRRLKYTQIITQS